jgi:hypothetical protein
VNVIERRITTEDQVQDPRSTDAEGIRTIN